MEMVNAMRAGKLAARPASIWHTLREKFFPNGGINFVGIGVRAKFVVVDGQKVKVVHDFHKVRGAYLAHLILLVVKFPNFPIHTPPRLFDE